MKVDKIEIVEIKKTIPGSLPDIDIDVMPSKKEIVKNYLRDKYGSNSFCYIGTYSSLQIKGCIKELARIYNIDFSKANYITSILDFEDETWDEIFLNAVQKPQLRKFIEENPNLFNDIPIMLGALKSESIHACATLLTPEGKDIFNWIPIRIADKEGEQVLVSQWEGEPLAESGFLKEDILVIDQLDKFRYCLDLIKDTVGDVVDIYNLPLDDEGVLDLFRQGYNSDIFQFGSKGLTQYCKELRPDSINELIDATALYRPGAMESNFHNEYILRKFGQREITYSFGLKEITEETKGVICYQEQVMKACQVLGGFSLAEADDIRKAIVKKRDSIIQGYKDKFLSGAINNGCPEDEANEIWKELEVHGSYSFNRSHAAAYTLISWVGQWLKYHYPIQFWTTALQFAKEEDVPLFINEIHKLENIKIYPPDINNSGSNFTTNYEKSEIYWSLAKIKFCGEKAVAAILNEREKNGEFYSLAEFLKRIEKRTVNKRIVINLILSGAFDSIEYVESEKDRMRLIKMYYTISKSKKEQEDQEFDTNSIYDWWWVLKQREITGFGVLNFRSIIKQNDPFFYYIEQYIDAEEFFEERNENKEFVVAGLVTRFIERSSKKGEYCHIELDSNNEVMNITIWNDKYVSYKDLLKNCEGKIMLVKGTCKYDSFKKKQVLQSNDDTIIDVI